MVCKKSLQGIFALVLVFGCGCAHLGEKPLIPGSPEDLAGCFAPFPGGPWESVHKIEAAIRGKVFSTLLGVTRGDPGARRLHSFLLAPEGFVLFEAELREGEVLVRKAVPPFDSPAFARGLLDDVAFLFLPPVGAPKSWGKDGDGLQVCRWEDADGSGTEIRRTGDGGWEILRRDSRGRPIKEVGLRGPFPRGLAAQVDFQAHSPALYRLQMTLLPTAP